MFVTLVLEVIPVTMNNCQCVQKAPILKKVLLYAYSVHLVKHVLYHSLNQLLVTLVCILVEKAELYHAKTAHPDISALTQGTVHVNLDVT